MKLTTTKSGDLVAVEIHDGIFRIDSVLSTEDMAYLRNLSDTSSDADWRLRNYKVLREQAVGLYGEDESLIQGYVERNGSEYWDDKLIEIPDKDFCNKINERLKPFFEGNYDLVYLQEIQRQYAGVGLGEHYDQDYDMRVKRAVVIYVNDDFIGGELYFPDRNYEIRPLAGSCITFPASSDYVHGVREVGVGPQRYAMAGFAWEYGSIDSWVKDH